MSSDSWQNLYGCNDQRVESAVVYLNHVFCAATSTRAFYLPNRVQGWWNGNLTGSYNSYVDGSCSFLLTRHYELIRTLN